MSVDEQKDSNDSQKVESGSDVKSLKKLLAKGFQITEKSYSLVSKPEYPPGKGDMTITVHLKKGEKEEQIKSTDDPEFFPFLNHFVFMQDEHDNSVAVYVDDPSKFEPRDANKIPMPKDDQHIIFIGSRKFEKGISVGYISTNPRNTLEAAAGFRIRKDKSPEINEVDYKDEVKIIEKSSGNTVFAGFIQGAINADGIISFRCLAGTKNSSYQKLSYEPHFTNTPDELYFISKTAGGLKVKFGESFLKKINLHEREFLLIMPLENLILREDLAFGDVTIYHNFDSNEDYLIRKSKTGSKDSDWNGNKLRIKTIVKATDFFDAIMKGYQKISGVIDWLALRSDFSFPSYENKGTKSKVYFSMYRHMSKIRTPQKIFCKELNDASFVFFDMHSILETILVFDHEARSFFDAVKELIEPLLAKSEDQLSTTERALLSSIHWLRLGIFSQNLIERLMFLYNSLEFAIADLSGEKPFSKDELKQLRQNITSLSLNAKQQKKVDWAFGDLNKSSLNEIITQFCNNEGISMTSEEWNIVKKCREKRNDVIHGKKDVIINSDETDKLQTLIERILLKRLAV